jgi:uncharacterized protein YndB with AHSA1/START domain
MTTLSHQIRISAPRDHVYEALSTRDGVAGWFTGDLEGAVSDGEEALFKFTGREPFRWRFAELSPGSRLRWECTQGPGNAAGTTATFSVSETNDGRTQVDLDHDGFGESDPALATCNTLWGILMGHLKTYAETTVPSPAFG